MTGSTMGMETLAQSLERLSAQGYVDGYRAEREGLRSLAHGTIHPPESFHVDEVVRFEGDSDPSDESAVFALSSDSGERKGTYTVGYGSLIDALDASIVRRLRSDA
jgi:hypothetical protein